MPHYEEIEFLPHCKLRMQERGISRQEILDTIKNPDIIYPSAHGKGRSVFRKTINGKYLFVVIKEVQNGKKAIIFTVARDN